MAQRDKAPEAVVGPLLSSMASGKASRRTLFVVLFSAHADGERRGGPEPSRRGVASGKVAPSRSAHGPSAFVKKKETLPSGPASGNLSSLAGHTVHSVDLKPPTDLTEPPTAAPTDAPSAAPFRTAAPLAYTLSPDYATVACETESSLAVTFF